MIYKTKKVKKTEAEVYLKNTEMESYMNVSPLEFSFTSAN